MKENKKRNKNRQSSQKLVSCTIHNLDASKATGPDRIPPIVPKMSSPELYPVLAKLYNKCLAKFGFPSVGNLHRLCQFLKMERDLIQVSIIL